jgi:hypothetical protein
LKEPYRSTDHDELLYDHRGFDQIPVTENAGHMVISDGAILPLSGIIDNTGTIELNSAGSETDLEPIEHGITLQGHGQVILSDSDQNVITAKPNKGQGRSRFAWTDRLPGGRGIGCRQSGSFALVRRSLENSIPSTRLENPVTACRSNHPDGGAASPQ